MGNKGWANQIKGLNMATCHQSIVHSTENFQILTHMHRVKTAGLKRLVRWHMQGCVASGGVDFSTGKVTVSEKRYRKWVLCVADPRTRGNPPRPIEKEHCTLTDSVGVR